MGVFNIGKSSEEKLQMERVEHMATIARLEGEIKTKNAMLQNQDDAVRQKFEDGLEDQRRQQEEYDRQMEDTKRRAEAAWKVQLQFENTVNRFSALVDRWEKQSDRVDVLLSRFEKTQDSTGS